MKKLIAHFESKKQTKIAKALKRILKSGEGDCEPLATTIGGAFVWADTVEGHDFWGEVDNQLEADGYYDE